MVGIEVYEEAILIARIKILKLLQLRTASETVVRFRQSGLASMVWWLSGLPLDLKFAGSNPAEDHGFLRAIKIRVSLL
jgi:hypothetical protein